MCEILFILEKANSYALIRKLKMRGDVEMEQSLQQVQLNGEEMEKTFEQFKEASSRPVGLTHCKEVKVGGDSGKSYTKLCLEYSKGGEKVLLYYSLPTSYEMHEQKAALDGVHEIIINGVRYLVGGSQLLSNQRDKSERTKELPLHRICLITGICKLLEENKIKTDNIKLTVNMPLADFKNKEKQQSLINFYQSAQKVRVQYKKEEYKFTFKVLPYYEGIGAILNKQEEFADKEVLALDFGSLNVGYATFSKLKPNIQTSGTLNEGVNRLFYRIRKALSENGVNIGMNEEQLKEIIKGESEIVSETTQRLVNKEVIDFLDSVYAELLNLGADVDYSHLLIIGGGTNLYRSFIPLVFKKAHELGQIHFIDNPEFANALGSLRLIG